MFLKTLLQRYFVDSKGRCYNVVHCVNTTLLQRCYNVFYYHNTTLTQCCRKTLLEHYVVDSQ